MYGEIAYWALGGACLLIAAPRCSALPFRSISASFIGIVELIAAALILRRWRNRA